MHADTGVGGGARGAGDKAHARTAGYLRFGHEGRAFLAADDEFNVLAVAAETVEHGQVAAGDTEGVGHALGHQALDQQMAGQLGSG